MQGFPEIQNVTLTGTESITFNPVDVRLGYSYIVPQNSNFIQVDVENHLEEFFTGVRLLIEVDCFISDITSMDEITSSFLFSDFIFSKNKKIQLDTWTYSLDVVLADQSKVFEKLKGTDKIGEITLRFLSKLTRSEITDLEDLNIVTISGEEILTLSGENMEVL